MYAAGRKTPPASAGVSPVPPMLPCQVSVQVHEPLYSTVDDDEFTVSFKTQTTRDQLVELLKKLPNTEVRASATMCLSKTNVGAVVTTLAMMGVELKVTNGESRV